MRSRDLYTRTILGSKVPLRFRGASTSTGPMSVTTILGPVPFRELPNGAPPGSHRRRTRTIRELDTGVAHQFRHGLSFRPDPAWAPACHASQLHRRTDTPLGSYGGGFRCSSVMINKMIGEATTAKPMDRRAHDGARPKTNSS